MRLAHVVGVQLHQAVLDPRRVFVGDGRLAQQRLLQHLRRLAGLAGGNQPSFEISQRPRVARIEPQDPLTHVDGQRIGITLTIEQLQGPPQSSELALRLPLVSRQVRLQLGQTTPIAGLDEERLHPLDHARSSRRHRQRPLCIGDGAIWITEVVGEEADRM